MKILTLKPAQLNAACKAWDTGGCQTLGHWLAQSQLGRDYYSQLVGLVRAKLGDTVDYSQEGGVGMVMQIGDRVQWTHVSQRGRTMSMSLREGTIEAIDGALAIVRTGTSRQVQVALARLRAMGQPTQLDEFMGAMREANQ